MTAFIDTTRKLSWRCFLFSEQANLFYKHTTHNLHTNGDEHMDWLVQDCSDSSALAMELMQSCAKPLIYPNNILVLSLYVYHSMLHNVGNEY